MNPWKLAGALIAMLAVGALAPTKASPAAVLADTCKSTKLTVSTWPATPPYIEAGQTAKLTCGGGCDNDAAGTECRSRQTTSPTLGKINVCSCDPVTLPLCCSLVVKVDGSNDPPSTEGDCVSCPSGGTTCKAHCISSEPGPLNGTTTTWTAVCSTQTSSPCGGGD